MKKRIQILLTTLTLALIVQFNVFAQDNASLTPYLGTWALTLPPFDGTFNAGWLEVTQEDGYIGASVLWYGGSVVPVSHAYLEGDDLVVTFVGERNLPGDKKAQVTSWLKMHLEGETLNGVRYFPRTDGTRVERASFYGKKLPADPPAPDLAKVKFGPAINLLDQNSLKGWEIMGDDVTSGWSVANGVLTNNPVQNDPNHHIHYGNLRTLQEFEDFNLSLEVNIPEGNNSGVYLRGIYEIQVFDSYGKPVDPHNMGALYSRITPSMAAEKPAGQWQTLDITLVDRHVTVILNGKKIIDNQPVRGCTGGAITSNEFIPGPIYLQGDHGMVEYRNIVLKPVVK
ncbi:MAG TPA: DUF1080 domain-containing protein [Saprospiraceae bacterium]|nr:DUF1080 domain-containing protein [Saprospiraceae bacterium]HPG07997.1 DUF1080 domain-containing protein [Saprospiraceae bacterium]HRV84734.1 DUF1080 domain-containing protein [Saprospiraceae bacterium]